MPNIQTASQVDGDGYPLILVHGLGLNRHMWQWQVPALIDRYKVVTYDLQGHGETDKPDGPYSMQDFVDQLLSVADQYGFEEFALAGFSLGGLIVKNFTIAHPSRVKALGILHAAYNRTLEQRASIMDRVHQAAEGGPGVTVDQALDRWFSVLL